MILGYLGFGFAGGALWAWMMCENIRTQISAKALRDLKATAHKMGDQIMQQHALHIALGRNLEELVQSRRLYHTFAPGLDVESCLQFEIDGRTFVAIVTEAAP
jgi:hypothetical protein